jgi:predicted RNA-binding Zn-ribbon protein involved in translation (DUF1610 family)
VSWSVRFRDIEDIQHHQGWVSISCPGCGRQVFYDPAAVINYFRSKNWNTSLEVAGHHFRCEKCGHKGARVSPSAPQRSYATYTAPIPTPEMIANPGRRRR